MRLNFAAPPRGIFRGALVGTDSPEGNLRNPRVRSDGCRRRPRVRLFGSSWVAGPTRREPGGERYGGVTNPHIPTIKFYSQRTKESSLKQLMGLIIRLGKGLHSKHSRIRLGNQLIGGESIRESLEPPGRRTPQSRAETPKCPDQAGSLLKLTREL